MQTNPAVKQNEKNIKWSESPCNQSGRKEKGLWRKWFAKSHVLSSEWKTERVREDASGDRKDGDRKDGEEDDELPCVIGESEGDCVWRGQLRLVALVQCVSKKHPRHF